MKRKRSCMKLISTNLVAAAAVLLMLSMNAQATLSNSYQFNGTGNWSIDAVGSNSSPVGDLTAIIPTGSTIERAFLYLSMSVTDLTPTVNFDGVVYTNPHWTELGANGFMEAYRADVTSQVAAKVGGGGGAPFTFSIQSETPTVPVDGEVLAIVYSNPAEQVRTIAFLDGFSASGGDTTSINLADPLTAAQLADPNFEALMSLGIGFSFRPGNQFSTVDVNGQRLTSDAGGQDDGIPNSIGNGGLITVGGIGDNPDNPADPLAFSFSNPLLDDELYTLTPSLVPAIR